MDMQGITGAPYKHPITRRKIPAPFTRPSITASGGTPVRRVWKDTSVLKLKEGDTVANFGTVEAVVEFIDTKSDQPWYIRVYNVMGEYRDFTGSERVYSFSGSPDE